MDQFASKVVEKCLKIGGSEFLDRYLARVCTGRADRPRMPLIDSKCEMRLCFPPSSFSPSTVAGDQYGNYLIQWILTNASPHQRDLVASHIRYGQTCPVHAFKGPLLIPTYVASTWSAFVDLNSALVWRCFATTHRMRSALDLVPTSAAATVTRLMSVLLPVMVLAIVTTAGEHGIPATLVIAEVRRMQLLTNAGDDSSNVV